MPNQLLPKPRFHFCLQRPATKLVQILSDSTVTDNENNPLGLVKYSFSREMREIIKDSTLWGRVRNAVVFAFTSKY
jgi:hypothetical protein